MGTELSPTAAGAQSCLWGSGGPSVVLTLDENSAVDSSRGVFPNATDVSVAGHDGLSITLEDQGFTTIIVDLDDGGVVQVQVIAQGGVPADPAAAGLAVAEAVFAGGPVLARPVTEPSGSALGYSGDICDLVSLEEMKQTTGKRKFSTVQADTPETCTYASSDFSLVISVGFIEGEPFQFQGGDAEELDVGGRFAVWSTQFFDSLVVDIGGGRSLQIGLIVYGGRPGPARDAAVAVAELALGRLVPVEGAGPTAPVAAGPGCDLLPVEQVAGITGLPFAVASDEDIDGVGCSYTSADPGSQPLFIVVAQLDVDDPVAAATAMSQGMSGLPEPQDIDIAGAPGLLAVGELGVLAAVDLDAFGGHEGQVLAVLWLAPPVSVDAASLVTRLAEAAVADL